MVPGGRGTLYKAIFSLEKRSAEKLEALVSLHAYILVTYSNSLESKIRLLTVSTKQNKQNPNQKKPFTTHRKQDEILIRSTCYKATHLTLAFMAK